MVTQTIIHEYGFETLEDYFDYIIESRFNGQHKQARELFNALGNEQQGHFFNYYEVTYHYEAHNDGLETTYVQELKDYLFNKPKTNK